MKIEDVEFLNSNCKADKTDPDYDPLALHIFYKNAEVREQNKIALSYIEETQKMEKITAKDSFSENCPINEKTKLGILRALEVKDPKDTGQLCYQLKVSKCCRSHYCKSQESQISRG